MVVPRQLDEIIGELVERVELEQVPLVEALHSQPFSWAIMGPFCQNPFKRSSDRRWSTTSTVNARSFSSPAASIGTATTLRITSKNGAWVCGSNPLSSAALPPRAAANSGPSSSTISSQWPSCSSRIFSSRSLNDS